MRGEDWINEDCVPHKLVAELQQLAKKHGYNLVYLDEDATFLTELRIQFREIEMEGEVWRGID